MTCALVGHGLGALVGGVGVITRCGEEWQWLALDCLSIHRELVFGLFIFPYEFKRSLLKLSSLN
jgi:hypothetical protein